MDQSQVKEIAMPLIGIHPKTDALENWADSVMKKTRQALKDTMHQISGFHTSDVIITLHKCDVKNPDPNGADFVVFIDTNPNEKLEAVADKLCSDIATVLINMGFASKRDVEVWPRFLPGSWCLVRDNRVYETVSHDEFLKRLTHG